MNKKKGAISMTDTMVNTTQIYNTIEKDIDCNTPRLDAILSFIKMKRIAKNQKDFINEQIIKKKDVRNGRAVLKDTRITPEEVVLMINEIPDINKITSKNILKYLSEQYPSINNTDQVVASILYTYKKHSTLLFIWRVMTRE